MTQKGKRIERGALLSLAVPSNPEFLGVVRSTVASLAELLGFASRDCRSVTLAVDEAMTNIIRHAYRSQKDRPINVICRRVHARSNGDGKRRAALEITLVDYGPAVDPTRLNARSVLSDIEINQNRNVDSGGQCRMLKLGDIANIVYHHDRVGCLRN